MCMTGLADAAATPMNMVGGLWGDDNLGEQSLGYKTLKKMDPSSSSSSSTTQYATPKIVDVGAMQRRSTMFT